MLKYINESSIPSVVSIAGVKWVDFFSIQCHFSHFSFFSIQSFFLLLHPVSFALATSVICLQHLVSISFFSIQCHLHITSKQYLYYFHSIWFYFIQLFTNILLSISAVSKVTANFFGESTSIKKLKYICNCKKINSLQ